MQIVHWERIKIVYLEISIENVHIQISTLIVGIQ